MYFSGTESFLWILLKSLVMLRNISVVYLDAASLGMLYVWLPVSLIGYFVEFLASSILNCHLYRIIFTLKLMVLFLLSYISSLIVMIHGVVRFGIW